MVPLSSPVSRRLEDVEIASAEAPSSQTSPAELETVIPERGPAGLIREASKPARAGRGGLPPGRTELSTEQEPGPPRRNRQFPLLDRRERTPGRWSPFLGAR